MSAELTWAPAWRLQELIKAKEVSPLEVMDHFLGRIEEFGPRLKAFDHLDLGGARRQAKQAEAAVLAGETLGPLHGVPMTVKNHIEVEGFPRPAPPVSIGGVSRHDDIPVERLRRAGAIIVGQNTMPAFLASGTLDLDALARNPWDLDRIPGASSSGGAASVAAGLVPAVLGTDGGGSTRLPAAFSGLVGMHPTDRSVPRMINPEHFHVNIGYTVGPIARDVRDAATVLSVIAGPDALDPLALSVDLPDPLVGLDDGAAGMRLAWSDDLGFARAYAVEETPRVIAQIRSAAFALRGTGATVEETAEQWEDYGSGASVYDLIFPDAILGGGSTKPTAEQWEAATRLRQRNWGRFQALFREYDLLVCPAQTSIAPTFEEFRRTVGVDGPPDVTRVRSVTIYLGMFNWLGFPAAAVCCGFVDGMPVAVQIVGPPGSDAKILRLAHAMRRAFPQDERPAIA